MSVFVRLDDNGDTRLKWAPVDVPDALIVDIETAFPLAVVMDAFHNALKAHRLIYKSDHETELINLEVTREFDPSHQGAYIEDSQLQGG